MAALTSYMYNSVAEIVETAIKQDKPIWELMLEQEIAYSRVSRRGPRGAKRQPSNSSSRISIVPPPIEQPPTLIILSAFFNVMIAVFGCL